MIAHTPMSKDYSTKSVRQQWHPREDFLISFTFRRWVPIFASFLRQTVSFQDKYGFEMPYIETPALGDQHLAQIRRLAINQKDKVFMFGNHPITHVVMSGYLTDLRSSMAKNGFWRYALVLDDGSGEHINAFIFSKDRIELKLQSSLTFYGKPVAPDTVKIIEIIQIKAMEELLARWEITCQVLHQILAFEWKPSADKNIQENTKDKVNLFWNKGKMTPFGRRKRIRNKYLNTIGSHCAPPKDIFTPSLFPQMEAVADGECVSLVISKNYWIQLETDEKPKEQPSSVEIIEIDSD